LIFDKVTDKNKLAPFLLPIVYISVNVSEVPESICSMFGTIEFCFILITLISFILIKYTVYDTVAPVFASVTQYAVLW